MADETSVSIVALDSGEEGTFEVQRNIGPKKQGLRMCAEGWLSWLRARWVPASVEFPSRHLQLSQQIDTLSVQERLRLQKRMIWRCIMTSSKANG